MIGGAGFFVGEESIPNDVKVTISGESLVGAAISGVNASFGQMQQSAGQTNATLAQTATALAGVEAQGAKLSTTLREAGSSQQIIRTLQELAANGNAAAGQVAPLIAQLQRVEGEGSKASLSIRQVDGAIKGMSVSVREASTVATPWVQSVNQLSSVIPGLSSAIPGLSQALNLYTQNMRAGAVATTQAAEAQGAAAQSSTGLGAALGPVAIAAVAAAAGIAGIAAAIKASVQEFGAFQAGILKVQALTGASSDEAAKYADHLRQLAKDGPVSARELADGLYYISSAGFHGAEALQVLDAAQRATAANMGSFTNVADAVTSVLKAYHLSVDQAANVTDIFGAAVIEGKVEADTFAQSIGQVLPIAANLGVGFEQVSAAIAAMTNQGIRADEATTALKGFFNELLSPGKESTQQLEELGLTARGLREILADPSPGQGLPEALRILQERTGGNVEQLGRIIPNVRALTGYLAIAGTAQDEYNRILYATTHAQGRVASAQEITNQGIQQQAKIMHNAMDEMGLAIGEVAVPPLTEFIRHVTTGIHNTEDFVARVHSLSDALGGLPARLAGAAAGFVSMLGPLGMAVEFIREGLTLAGQVTESGPPNRSTGPVRDDYRLGDRAGDGTSTGSGRTPEAAPALLTPEALRANAQAMSAVGTEADKLHNTMIQLFHLPEGSDPAVINKRLAEMYSLEAQIGAGWTKAFDPAHPEQAAERISHLKSLMDDYNAAVTNNSKEQQAAAQVAIDSYLHEVAADQQRDSEAKKTAASQRAAVAEAEREIRQHQQALVRSQQELLTAQVKHDADMLTVQANFNRSTMAADAQVADARESAQQTEADRQYDIWASAEIKRLVDADKNGMELQRLTEKNADELARIKDQRAREDVDREEQAGRAVADRAAQAARRISDIQTNQAQTAADAARHFQQRQQEATTQHQERLAEIQRKGGPGMVAALADENRNFQQEQTRAQRAETTSIAEAQVKANEQISAAKRQAAEQEADAARKTKEAAADLDKSRSRQDADRKSQQADAETQRKQQQADADALQLKKLGYEQAFFVDAESKAAAKLQADFARIDARYQHEQLKIQETEEIRSAAAAHSLAAAAIKAQQTSGALTPEAAAEALGREEAGYNAQQIDIQGRYGQQSIEVDTALRQRISGISQSGRSQNFAGATTLQGASKDTVTDVGPQISITLSVTGNTFVGSDPASAQAIWNQVKPQLMSDMRSILTSGRLPS